tara:strand:- start:43300 stop:43590 length:291 start_codon:yes stop_codon:yes gene_type:complete
MKKEGFTITINAPNDLINLIKQTIRDEIKQSNSISVERDKYVTIETVSKKLHLSRTAIYERIHQGKITLFKEGRRSLFDIDEIENLINSSSIIKNK